MSSCRSCGRQLGAAELCPGCGTPVDSSTREGTPASTPANGDWRTDTAERKVPRVVAGARTPPAAVAPLSPPRYPLYADEVEEYSPYGPLSTSTDADPDPDGSGTAPGEPPFLARHDLVDSEQDDDERRSPVLWVLAAVLVLGLVAAGWWFLVNDGSGDGSSDLRPQDPGTAVEMAVRASAKAPETAPPDEDVDGEQVSSDASNMLDGVPETAWRAAGDATGMELRFTLPGDVELERVGLINGYAKTSTDAQGVAYDWYLGERRVDAVVWVFDDGSKVRQQLEDDRKLQLVDVGPVTTHRVVLRLVAVSEPGEGPARRDFTAISEVSLLATPES